MAALRTVRSTPRRDPVVLGETHLDVLAARGRHVLADVVGAQRQLAVAAVDEHRQLHGTRPADVAQRVQRRADRATGVEHVVDQDHQRAVDATLGNRGVLQRPRGLDVEVIAVQRDVQRAARHVDAGELADLVGDPGGQRHTAGRNAEEDDARRVRVVQCGLFDDLMSDAGDGTADVGGGHQFPVGARRAHGETLTSFSASLDGSLKDVELPRKLNTSDPVVRHRHYRAVSGSRSTLAPMNLDGNHASIGEAIDTGLLAGAVTLVWQSGEVLQVNELGYRDVDAGLPMQRDTIFRIASMSKPVTVAAAMALMEEGKLTLADPVAKWLPELSDMQVLRRGPGTAGPDRAGAAAHHDRRPDDAPQRAGLCVLGARSPGPRLRQDVVPAGPGPVAGRVGSASAGAPAG